jgi:hypothetical protein
MSDPEATELVLAIAERRRQGRYGNPRRKARSALATPTGPSFTKRTCLALFIANALVYVATFGVLAALPWAAMAIVVHRAPA